MSAAGYLTLDRGTAIAFAECALHNLEQRYPYATQHLSRGDSDFAAPHTRHPIFFGCYDWHSSVHMHWSLIRLLRLDANLPQRSMIHRHFAARFTAANAHMELAYLKENPGFERAYGWGWLLQLHSELLDYGSQHAPALRWAARVAPIAAHVLKRWCEFLPLSRYPQRAGTHANSAFAMTLAFRYAKKQRDHAAQRAISAAALRWFLDDRRYPARYEPGGNDFLSAGLCEAILMSEVREREFAKWWTQFDPGAKAIQTWLKPVRISSRTDGQLVHLDGLNLSRAWCLRSLARRLPEKRAVFDTAAQSHLAAAMPHVTGGDFVATHWLVSFALLAITDTPGQRR